MTLQSPGPDMRTQIIQIAYMRYFANGTHIAVGNRKSIANNNVLNRCSKQQAVNKISRCYLISSILTQCLLRIFSLPFHKILCSICYRGVCFSSHAINILHTLNQRILLLFSIVQRPNDIEIISQNKPHAISIDVISNATVFSHVSLQSAYIL